MHLASVKALKEELLKVPYSIVERVATSRALSAFTESEQLASRALAGIALGISGSGGKYRLAIRQQQSGRLVNAVCEKIEELAHGEVDVRFIGNLIKFAKPSSFFRARRRPLTIGASISDVLEVYVSAGTLGCFVWGKEARRYLYLLTNNHVIANENGNRAGDEIVQPGTLDRGSLPSDLIGELGRFVRLQKNGINYVDAALAHVYEEEYPQSMATIPGLGELAGEIDVAKVPAKAKVYKVGRTTGQTEGRITAFDVDNIHVEYDMGTIRFDNQIEIEGAGSKPFSDAGDSGAMIVDKDLRAVGLLFAGSDSGGSNRQGLTYANPITTVFDKLKVELAL